MCSPPVGRMPERIEDGDIIMPFYCNPTRLSMDKKEGRWYQIPLPIVGCRSVYRQLSQAYFLPWGVTSATTAVFPQRAQRTAWQSWQVAMRWPGTAAPPFRHKEPFLQLGHCAPPLSTSRSSVGEYAHPIGGLLKSKGLRAVEWHPPRTVAVAPGGCHSHYGRKLRL